jgi:hypothetical protein
LRLLRLTPKIGTLHLYSLSTLRRSQLFEYLCCLAAYHTCTKLPGSASDGAFEALTSPALLPLLGPLNAPGHASNAFRRDAARSFGLHATPAPFFTLSSRGCSRLPLREFTPSSSSAPAFAALLHRLSPLLLATGSSYPCGPHNFHIFTSRRLDSPLFTGRAPGDSLVCSQPLRHSLTLAP